MGCEENCAPSAGGQHEAAADSGERELFIVVSSDFIGKDENIGKVLMKGFFETMLSTGALPRKIFFLNAGVKLTTTDEEISSILRDIEAKGVEIFSCGTCLKHYGLEDKLKVGFRGTTAILLENLQETAKAVWI